MTLKTAAVSEAIAPTAVQENCPLWSAGTSTDESPPHPCPCKDKSEKQSLHRTLQNSSLIFELTGCVCL